MENKKSKRKLKPGVVVLRTVICVLTALILILALLFSGVAVINYGPSKTVRDLFVVSMLETSAAKFLATWYFSGEEIDSILAENAVIEDTGISDPSFISIGKKTEETGEADIYFPYYVTDDGPYITYPADTDEYEGYTTVDPAEETTAVSEEKKDIEIFEVSGSGYSGFMMKVADPSRLFVGTRGDYSEAGSGKTILQIAKSYNATAAINAGGFEDRNGSGDGGIPLGLVISEGKLLWGEKNKSYDVIGFNSDDILIVGTMTAQSAIDAGIRDAVSFGPVLVKNGKASSVKGSGSGVNPRTAIGQCADGSVLLLVIDGRQASSLGATYADLINIMMEYGAVNAANLDGGNSSGMYYNGKLVNKGLFLRGLPTCFIVR